MDDEYCIKSGEFQKLCNTTRDTLRFYREQGILVPHRNEENGYYMYSYAQVGSYHLIRSMREMGSTVEEVKRYLETGDRNTYKDLVEAQYNELVAHRDELDAKIRTIENLRVLMEFISKIDIGEPVCDSFEYEFRFNYSKVESKAAYSMADVAADVEHHMRAFENDVSRVSMGVVIDRKDFLNGDYRYQQIFDTHISRKAGSITKLAGIVCREEDGDITVQYERLSSYVNANGLVPVSDFYSLSVLNGMDLGGDRRYLKCVAVMVE